jgi:imidazolonepropionase
MNRKDPTGRTDIPSFTVVRNILQLATPVGDGKPFLRGNAMREIATINHAALVTRSDTIEWVGRDADLPGRYTDNSNVIDGSGLVALPGFVDMHTHMVFGATREDEFAMRCSGASYQEIAANGGGINNTVRTTREADKSKLRKQTMRYLDKMIRHGTTTVEIKSGYGLTERDERKMLEVISSVRADHLITVVPTFLGAHALPPEYRERRGEYVDLVCNRMIPYVAERKLTEFCDVFCENGFFTLEESKRILETGKQHGLTPKIHADELSPLGGAELAVEVEAISADHLEHISNKAIDLFARSDVIAGMLPGVSFYLGHDYAPARKLIDAGAIVALATDFNPGSCMSYSVPLMMTMACTQMKMTPEETLTAGTLNAAAALGLSDRFGSIETGKQADIVFLQMPNYRYLPYHFGENHVAAVMKSGTWLEYR